MGKSTTSNQKRSIATKGTNHLAFAIHPDFCLPKGSKKQEPYDNWVGSTDLKKGKTETALIGGKAVWTEKGELGPDSYPKHAGTDKGINSKTYCAEAKALSFSNDVNFEGNHVVRLDDLTTQNHANTVGRVLEAPLTGTFHLYVLALMLGHKPWKDEITIVRRGNVFVIVDKKNKVIVLLGTQQFHGNGATQAAVDKATNVINKTWSGSTTWNGESYQVRSLITGSVRGADETPIAGANQIKLVFSSDPEVGTGQRDPAFQYFYDNGGGYQHTNDLDNGRVTSAHEFGHAMGIDDEYRPGPNDAQGRRTSISLSPPGSLMGENSSVARPTVANYNMLITGIGLVPGAPAGSTRGWP